MPEFAGHQNSLLFVLCGTKADLEDRQISQAQLVELGKEINAFAVVGCRSLTQTGVKEAFEICIRAALVESSPDQGNEVCCQLL
jgi:GTPase SAR1 family protein